MTKTKMMFGERRLYPRKACRFAVEVDDHFRSYVCDLRDLSVGGVLLEHPSTFKPVLGQELLVIISFRNRPGELMVQGQITRIHAGQLAVAFTKTRAASLHQAA